LRATLQPKLPGSPVEVHPLTEQVERALVRERLMATLAAGFGVLGLVLAAVGLYGLLSYTVAGRTNEIGIRLALGAMRGEVLWMVIRHVLILLAVGVAIGLPVAWACSHRLVDAVRCKGYRFCGPSAQRRLRLPLPGSWPDSCPPGGLRASIPW
jgi:ABC-type lipoprotein release transport system permease subunit